jgi:hypothetical protein
MTPLRTTAIWLSPIAGAFAVALFLGARALAMSGSSDYVLFPVIVWFIERAAVGYICALPLLFIAYRIGVRYAVTFMILASLAAFPLEYHTSNPLYAWHPSEEELNHGFYWGAFLPCVLLASATGAVFFWGVRRKKDA